MFDDWDAQEAKQQAKAAPSSSGMFDDWDATGEEKVSIAKYNEQANPFRQFGGRPTTDGINTSDDFVESIDGWVKEVKRERDGKLDEAAQAMKKKGGFSSFVAGLAESALYSRRNGEKAMGLMGNMITGGGYDQSRVGGQGTVLPELKEVLPPEARGRMRLAVSRSERAKVIGDYMDGAQMGVDDKGSLLVHTGGQTYIADDPNLTMQDTAKATMGVVDAATTLGGAKLGKVLLARAPAAAAKLGIITAEAAKDFSLEALRSAYVTGQVDLPSSLLSALFGGTFATVSTVRQGVGDQASRLVGSRAEGLTNREAADTLEREAEASAVKKVLTGGREAAPLQNLNFAGGTLENAKARVDGTKYGRAMNEHNQEIGDHLQRIQDGKDGGMLRYMGLNEGVDYDSLGKTVGDAAEAQHKIHQKRITDLQKEYEVYLRRSPEAQTPIETDGILKETRAEFDRAKKKANLKRNTEHIEFLDGYRKKKPANKQGAGKSEYGDNFEDEFEASLREMESGGKTTYVNGGQRKKKINTLEDMHFHLLNLNDKISAMQEMVHPPSELKLWTDYRRRLEGAIENQMEGSQYLELRKAYKEASKAKKEFLDGSIAGSLVDKKAYQGEKAGRLGGTLNEMRPSQLTQLRNSILKQSGGEQILADMVSSLIQYRLKDTKTMSDNPARAIYSALGGDKSLTADKIRLLLPDETRKQAFDEVVASLEPLLKTPIGWSGTPNSNKAKSVGSTVTDKLDRAFATLAGMSPDQQAKAYWRAVNDRPTAIKILRDAERLTGTDKAAAVVNAIAQHHNRSE